MRSLKTGGPSPIFCHPPPPSAEIYEQSLSSVAFNCSARRNTCMPRFIRTTVIIIIIIIIIIITSTTGRNTTKPLWWNGTSIDPFWGGRSHACVAYQYTQHARGKVAHRAEFPLTPYCTRAETQTWKRCHINCARAKISRAFMRAKSRTCMESRPYRVCSHMTMCSIEGSN